jgi:hypothetical protein
MKAACLQIIRRDSKQATAVRRSVVVQGGGSIPPPASMPFARRELPL